jgi:hypothetical protein
VWARDLELIIYVVVEESRLSTFLVIFLGGEKYGYA